MATISARSPTPLLADPLARAALWCLPPSLDTIRRQLTPLGPSQRLEANTAAAHKTYYKLLLTMAIMGALFQPMVRDSAMGIISAQWRNIKTKS